VIQDLIYNNISDMQNSTQNMMSLGTIKNDFTETGILNCTE